MSYPSRQLWRIMLWRQAVFSFDKDAKWASQKEKQTNTEHHKTEQHEPAIRCAFCQHEITRRQFAIEVAGQHQHVFTNPQGITFEIVTYDRADCVQHGVATTEYTWFAGCAWQVALCKNCKNHLGWRYIRPDSNGFYGLICEHIVESES